MQLKNEGNDHIKAGTPAEALVTLGRVFSGSEVFRCFESVQQSSGESEAFCRRCHSDLCGAVR